MTKTEGRVSKSAESVQEGDNIESVDEAERKS